MKRIKLPPWSWGIGLAVLAAGIWLARPLVFRPPAAPDYLTAPVKRQDLTQAVTASGQLSATVTVEVGSQISGIIQKLLADYNTPVRAGQVVAQLDPATYRATKHQAEGELANAKATLELARLNEKRQRDLVTGNAGTQADLDRAVADLAQAEAGVMIRQAQLDRATVDLDRCTITAPVDGVVISRDVNEGQTVAAAMQAPKLFTIANDLSKMQIEANVSEADIGGAKAGQTVEFTVDAFPGRTFQGKVKMVRFAPVTVENVVSYVTVIEVANPNLELRPGMTANVSIILEERKDVLTVPNAALRFRPSDGAPGPRSGPPPQGSPGATKQVHVLRDGRPIPAEVKTGLSDGVMTEIVSGVTEGDVVVTGQSAPAKSPRPSSSPLNPFGGSSRR